jgi:hypothetical protein
LRSNQMTSDNFEETQFFSTNYDRGLDWYLEQFHNRTTQMPPPSSSSSSLILFEKSANYFSEAKAPLRVKTLLKDVKLIVITIDPVQRAYSWYQVGIRGSIKVKNDTKDQFKIIFFFNYFKSI